MSKVFVDTSMSLDGFIAGPNSGPQNPLGDGGHRIHQWMYEVESWREHRQAVLRSWTDRRTADPSGPIVLGDGVPLFENTGTEHLELENRRVIDSPKVIDLRYHLVKED
jgi:hypothetical protein